MNILVVCAAGMSSSSFVVKMREEVKKRNLIDIKVGSCASNQVDKYIHETQLILLTPQLTYYKDELNHKYPLVPIKIIPSLVYGRQDVGEAINIVFKNEDIDSDKEIKFIQTLYKISLKIGDNKFLKALSDSFIKILPVTVIGAIALLLKNLPIESFQTFISNTEFSHLLQACVDVSTNMISVYISFFIAYHYSKNYKVPEQMAGLNALITFLMIAAIHPSGYIMVDFLGAKGIFTAIFTSFLSAKIFITVYQFDNRMIEFMSRINSKKIIDSFTSFIPILVSILITVSFVSLFRFLFNDTIPNVITLLLQNRLTALVGNNLFSDLSLMSIAQGLWFFGIHGGSIVGNITKPLYAPLALENLNAFNQGLSIPYMITSQFRMMFVFGGAGSTLGLVILMFFFSKSSHLKQIGRISLPLGIFFINETVLFGIPVVMNLIMLIPFVSVPLVSGLLTAFVMKIGLVPYAIGIEIPWTTPPILSGFIQGGYILALWQVLMIILSIILWYPFFKMMDNKMLKEEHL